MTRGGTAGRRVRLRRWWETRPLRTRITIVVGGVALVALLALARIGAGLMLDSLLSAADSDLRDRASTSADRVARGEATAPGIRVVDTAGTPVDGRGPVPIGRDEMQELAAGQPATVFAGGRPLRWAAVPVVVTDGSTRFVLAAGDLLGGRGLPARALVVFLLAAVVVAAAVTAAAWLATRAALRPVDRMRRAAAGLPPGERLPVPVARDELHGLATEINALLGRRDDAVARLERFTGDAAHELRSPVASLRAQAEVAAAYPDPDLADETLRAVAGEARRLTVMLDGLLALARADAGQRVPAGAVDLAGAARAARDRIRDGAGVPAGEPVAPGSGSAGEPAASALESKPSASATVPAIELVVPAAARAAASPSEVDLVLDNLLRNALRHARSVVRVAVLPAGRSVRLVVDDDGPGIPEPDRIRVFDRFTRLEPHAAEGAGLGLALVAAVVRGRGGDVAAGVSPSGGARLEVRWPAAVAAPPDSRPPAASPSAAAIERHEMAPRGAVS
ncbi:signal transduction histidine kinase [Pseudonocardia sediminis]|uniref:histidine kinase n=1 Tax=Pseudonocardia sediminis TaxID=1397368 RepID=A0A4Q7V0Y3_PSEST|nr:HAMP domain-containing sensor histidine kinase [Pseudonocardia sediminis]RZT86243.1 signal transduction histidine kinase [Pseudonocardia sediminis]